MVQKIKQAPLAARIGSGLAQGAGLQLPKEIEHYRISQGLRDLENQDLTPQQYFSRGITAAPGLIDKPQVVQSLADLSRQHMRGQALIQQQNQKNQPPPNPFPQQPPNATPNTNAPSVTKPKTLEEIQKGYIPPTQDQIYQEAGRRYTQNPALFGHDANNAIKAAEEAALKEKNIYDAYKQQHADLQHVQDNVVNRLQDFSDRLGAKVPANVFSKVEDKAIKAVLPKLKPGEEPKEGQEYGEGLTEQQAMKKYGEELDSISREYSKIKDMGGWAVTGRKAKDTQTALRALQQDFEKRRDTENLADSLIGENQISPKLAFAFAQPVYKVPEANKYIKNLKAIGPIETGFESAPNPRREILTRQISPELAEMVRKNDKLSPLAVAHELEKKGYDPSTWMEYLAENKEFLDLKDSQNRQLTRPLNAVDPLNDWWLESWSGIE